MNKDTVILAFDFSLSKPAMCALINGKYHFYTWPAKIDKKTYDKLIFDKSIEAKTSLLLDIIPSDPFIENEYSSSEEPLGQLKFVYILCF